MKWLRYDTRDTCATASADRSELIEDMLNGFHQVVGHTVTKQVEIVNRPGESVTFIDVLDHRTWFHEIDCL